MDPLICTKGSYVDDIFGNGAFNLKPDRKFYFMHTELKDSHEQIGSVGYTVMNDTPVGKIVGAGYFIYPKFWGKDIQRKHFNGF